MTTQEKLKTRIKFFLDNISDSATVWIGSTQSILLHTVFFIGIFGLVWFGVATNTILLILTTLVSLEAIYLSIFIQRTVTKQQKSIQELNEDIEDINEDLEEDK